mmetsp:Transcript_31519/g.47652  ORF Transcript_31519/g.47652 Transcript_31519/m.47652 type:complete len:232 (+) Transcript_31519:133-828(+)|eukprot:CAMPEP_0178919484 /NCGR_PEP_ID=MMETSP0786-20121207/14462_1 /TAXON_ID=186022 /ORGANISM="Thalassionema frauenfeldii, Strain CCMP 1798" /LENGTH=231 /DNA_ID=CAMNT_0020593419 /DNA_START=72 /DNA_END=767 /DNA_ORIENTATION=-
MNKNSLSNHCGIEQFRHEPEGITQSTLFPQKLYKLLQDVSAFGIGSNTIDWIGDGDTFVIYNPSLFAKTLMIKYFRTDKFSSFQRQLNSYGFKRTNLYASQKDVHIYRHATFHRNHPELLEKVTRKGKARKSAVLSSTEPLDKKNVTPISAITVFPDLPSSKSITGIASTASLLMEEKTGTKKDLILDAGIIEDDCSIEDDDFYLQLPMNNATMYSLSDWDVDKEALDSCQ